MNDQENREHHAPVVVKVGGSLLGWDELPRRLSSFLDREMGSGRPLVGRALLVAGGGGAADLIRALDQVHRLGEGASHRLALEAMDLTASILEAIVAGSRVVSTIEQIETARRERRIPVFAPRAFLEEVDARGVDPLPSSWDVTSDSIAARVARYLGADRLILLKSARIDEIATVEDAAMSGLVDPYFPIASVPLRRVEAACLRDPHAGLHQLIQRQRSNEVQADDQGTM